MLWRARGSQSTDTSRTCCISFVDRASCSHRICETISSIHAADGLASTHSRKAWHAAQETGNLDSFVCSYRAEPGILAALIADPASRPEVAELIVRSRDERIARQLGFPMKPALCPGVDPLTAREWEVLRELEQGSSNRDIAQRLFITESTVKTHLRHIYEKLGVRTRAELLARRARRP
jgi:ATP/maltotriose-dependent transcriptional regulator MalT